MYSLGNGMFNYWFMMPDQSFYTGLNGEGSCSHVLPYLDGICWEHYGSFEEVQSGSGLIDPDYLRTWVDWSNDIVVDEKRQGVQGIADIITIPGLVNVDFADVK